MDKKLNMEKNISEYIFRMSITFRCVSHKLCDTASFYIYPSVIFSYQLEVEYHVVDTSCYYINATKKLDS